MRLQQVDRGFNTDNILTMVVRLPEAATARIRRSLISSCKRSSECARCRRSFSGHRQLPAVVRRLGFSTGFKIEGRPEPPPGQGPSTDVRVVDAGYFPDDGDSVAARPQLLGTRTEEAKARAADQRSARARIHFPNEDPIGKRLDVAMFEKPTPAEIIGVVGNVRYDSLIDESPPAVYFPHPDLAYSFMTLVVRTDGDPAAIAPAVQREIRALDSNQPVSDVRTMNQVMSEWVSRSRFNTLLLGLFAGLATLLVGGRDLRRNELFGRVAHARARTRLAIGAQPRQVLLLVLKQGLLLTIVGVVLGLVAAFALTRLLSGLLFGVGAVDITTFTTISVLLVIVSLLACYLPARRAMRIDPLQALRYE